MAAAVKAEPPMVQRGWRVIRQRNQRPRHAESGKSGGRDLVACAPEKFIAEEEGVVRWPGAVASNESGVGAVEIREETEGSKSRADAALLWPRA